MFEVVCTEPISETLAEPVTQKKTHLEKLTTDAFILHGKLLESTDEKLNGLQLCWESSALS